MKSHNKDIDSMSESELKAEIKFINIRLGLNMHKQSRVHCIRRREIINKRLKSIQASES